MNKRSIQQIEYATDDRAQYLIIQKCGNSSLREAMGNPPIINTPCDDKVIFTVLRDPVERFISGFIYDLYNASIIDNSMSTEEIKNRVEDHVKRYDIYDVYTCMDAFKRSRPGACNSGSISHTIPQLSYIINQPIRWFIDINDLPTFLLVHYNSTHRENVSKVSTRVKNIIKKIILKEKQRLVDVHSADYYFIERIRENGLFWDWQNGKIF